MLLLWLRTLVKLSLNSKAKNKYLNWPSRENFIKKKAKINVILWPKMQKEISSEAAKDGIMTTKNFGVLLNLF